jgi:hypothetical protein
VQYTLTKLTDHNSTPSISLVPASITPSNAKRRDTQYQQSSQEIPNTYEASYSANGYQKNTSYLAEKDAAMYGFNI